MRAGAVRVRRDVPMDPYALGLLLGDGCLDRHDDTGVRHGRPGARRRAGDGAPGIELDRKGDVDYVLRHVDGRRGGSCASRTRSPCAHARARPGRHPVGDEVRARRATCTTRVEVRLAVLQGLLDTDGGPVTPGGPDLPGPVHDDARPSCATTSIFLVQSLGGVVYRRTRPAEGRKPGTGTRAAGRTTGTTPTSSTSGCRRASRRSGSPASASSTTPPAAAGRCVHRHASSPRAAQETVCIQVAAAGLAVRHRGLPGHPQHPQRRVHHPGRGAEHHAPSR